VVVCRPGGELARRTGSIGIEHRRWPVERCDLGRLLPPWTSAGFALPTAGRIPANAEEAQRRALLHAQVIIAYQSALPAAVPAGEALRRPPGARRAPRVGPGGGRPSAQDAVGRRSARLLGQ